MEWWQTVLVGSVPAIVAAASLIWQNHRNNERESQRRSEDVKERQKERAHASQEAQKERDHAAQMLVDANRADLARERDAADRLKAEALADKWRDERRTAHLALLAVLETGIEFLEKVHRSIRWDDSGQMLADVEELDALSNDYKATARRELAQVKMIGSKASRDSAAELWEKMNDLDVRIWAATFMKDSQHLAMYKRPEIDRQWAGIEPAHQSYISQIRKDLGTAD